jgi:hypothetical protein
MYALYNLVRSLHAITTLINALHVVVRLIAAGFYANAAQLQDRDASPSDRDSSAAAATYDLPPPATF